MSARLPSFLVVGAMKAGTTSLHRDLNLHPDIFLPEEKEPECLCEDRVLTPAGRAHYRRLFSPARSGQVRGEASTAYTKLPDVRGVPERAFELLGPELRIIYVVREPIARIASHHYHEYCLGLVEGDVDEAVRRHHRFIAYSRYAMQISAWIDLFGRDRVGVWRFEDYARDRAGVVAAMCTFLGVDPSKGKVLAGRKLNQSAGRTVPNAWWRMIAIDNPLYQRHIKRFIPWRLRQSLARALLPRGPEKPSPMSEHTVDYLRRALAGDAERLRSILGSTEPMWVDARSEHATRGSPDDIAYRGGASSSTS